MKLRTSSRNRSRNHKKSKTCVSGASHPLVPRWLLIIADILCFGLFCFLIHRVLALWHRGTSIFPIEILGSLWVHGWRLSPAAWGSHLGLDPRSPSGQSPHTGLRSRVLQRSSLPEVSQDLAEISPHHQNNYGLDAYKLKLENKPMNMSTTNNNKSRNSLPSPISSSTRVY